MSEPETAAVIRPQPRRRTRMRRWLCSLLILAILPGVVVCPPVWHGVLQSALAWQAARQGLDLSIGKMSGGPFDTTHFYSVRLRQAGLISTVGGSGTDISIAHAQCVLAWTVPWFQHAAPSWVHRITLEGVSGRWNLATGESAGGGSWLQRTLEGFVPKVVPTNFSVASDDLVFHRGKYRLRTAGLALSASSGRAGKVSAREVRVNGPGFESDFADWRGQTFWKGDRLTLTGLDLGHGVVLASATLDGSHLDRRRLDWEFSLTALGGEVRGQGAVNFSRARLALEVATTLHKTALGPLARMLEIPGTVDGQVDQASFTFRGDPENWTEAQMWLSARATDFRWDARQWQSLEMQAVVVNRRMQINRLELRQSRNGLSLTGECPLPPSAGFSWTGDGHWWQTAGFSCNIDARLEDLRALAQLAGPQAPELDGRMSINGKLGAVSGRAQIEGYLNIEGTRLTLLGAPLDYLRSTLKFRNGGLEVADLQATHDQDYFTSHGSMRLSADPSYQGELRAEIKDLSVYALAFASLPWVGSTTDIRDLNATLRLDDSVLYFDQCEANQAGDPFQIIGSVDLHRVGQEPLDFNHLSRTDMTVAALNP